MNRSRRAFSLVEVTVCLLIAAVLAAAVVLSMSGVSRARRLDDAVERLIELDLRTREHAERFGRSSGLAFDLDEGRASGAGSPALLLPEGHRIEAVATAGTGSRDTDGFVEFRGGKVVVPCSAHGQTPTYAVLLSEPKVEGDAGGAEPRHRWVLVAGTTGQPTVIEDDHELRAIFTRLGRRARGHTD